MTEMHITIHHIGTQKRYRLAEDQPTIRQWLFDHCLETIQAGKNLANPIYGIMPSELDEFIFLANHHNCQVIVV